MNGKIYGIKNNKNDKLYIGQNDIRIERQVC